MDPSIRIKDMREGEEKSISDMVSSVFNEFVAPGYSEQGVNEFMRYIKPGLIIDRLRKGETFLLVARDEERVVGVIETRDSSHISLMFVEKEYHNKAISRELFRLARERCLKNKPGIENITVNSSPYAVPVYEKLGFEATAEEQVKNGIRFVPMSIRI